MQIWKEYYDKEKLWKIRNTTVIIYLFLSY